MRAIFPVVLLLLGTYCGAQAPTVQTDSVVVDSFRSNPTDTIADPRPRSPNGNLLDDDPVYNRRYPVYVPAMRVVSADVFNWALARYIFKFDWAKISMEQWKKNLRSKWEWDNDRFGTNFIGHPHTGSIYFNVARSNGYSYLSSIPFAIGGSFIWEYFGENTSPSRNDLVNTPISGAFLGEIFYRISSNILDDRKRGGERVFRELLAAAINPTRALNRLTQGKMFRVTNREMLQQEPLNITISGGLHKVNDNNKFASGSTNAIINLQFDYGVPFEIRRRKPFDLFRLRLESRYGDDKRLIDNVLGYGLLWGRNFGHGKNHSIFGGVFQQFDYWNNNIFEIGSLGFGPGILVKLNTQRKVQFYSSLHLSGVPLSGYNTRFGPDTSEYRDYPFGGGVEGRVEERINVGRISVALNAYHYWIWNYEGSKGKTRITILKPQATFRVFNDVSLGFEHHVYYDDRYLAKQPTLHIKRTEQKFFVQVFLEDRKRNGNYH